MTDSPKLFMLLVGCKPPGRSTEQHDIFFDIGTDLKSLVPHIRDYWPEGGEKLHVDAWRQGAEGSSQTRRLRIAPGARRGSRCDEQRRLGLEIPGGLSGF